MTTRMTCRLDSSRLWQSLNPCFLVLFLMPMMPPWHMYLTLAFDNIFWKNFVSLWLVDYILNGMFFGKRYVAMGQFYAILWFKVVFCSLNYIEMELIIIVDQSMLLNFNSEIFRNLETSKLLKFPQTDTETRDLPKNYASHTTFSLSSTTSRS